MGEVSTQAAMAGFAGALRRLRREAGLSQEELAERAGLSVRGLRYLERGLRQPYRSTVVRLGEALGLDAHAAAALTAAGAAGADLPWSSQRPPRPPVPSGPLIGRERELDQALRLLRDDHVRLLTVTGLGGVGKTRFAVAMAARLEDATDAGVVWVPLADLADAAAVPRAVARAVGVVPADPSQLVNVLASVLGERVLLLDNAEHVAGCASFLADLVACCRSLRMIVTSRVALGVHVEQRFPLGPLAVPDPTRSTDPHALAVNPAVDLYLRRLQAIDPNYVLTAANADAVAAVVTQLEGLPLALELAAARSTALPPEAMATRMNRGLELLASDSPDLPNRQQTMRATIAWSYDLLSPDSRAFFRHVALFEDGVSLASIEALAGLSPCHKVTTSHTDQPSRRERQPLEPVPHQATLPHTLDHLDALLTSSLLRRDTSRPDTPRYRMHELVRSFGLEQLILNGDEEPMRRWHAEHLVRLAQEAERHFFGPHSATWLDRLEVEHANLRAALRWFRDHGPPDHGLALAGALSWFWYVRGHAVEGRTWLDTFLTITSQAASTTPTGVRVAALRGAGQLAQTQGDYHSARAYLRQAITLNRSTDDQPGLAATLLASGFVARLQEDYTPSVHMLHEAAAIARTSGLPFVTAATHHHLGMIALDAHQDPSTGRQHLQHSLRLYRQLHMTRFEALVLLSLANLAHFEGDLLHAVDLAERSLELMNDTGERLGLHGALDTLADIALTQGDPTRGVRLAAAAAHLRQLNGSQPWPVVQRRLQERLTTARAALTPDAYQDLWNDGHSMSTPDALAYALHGRWNNLSSPSGQDRPSADASPRENPDPETSHGF